MSSSENMLLESDEEKLIKNLKLIGTPGVFESEHLKELISQLSDISKRKNNESSNELFMEICNWTLEALAEYPDNPEDSPAAREILQFVKFAFKTYKNSIRKHGEAVLETNVRNGYLADAFGVNGRRGKGKSIEYIGMVTDIFLQELYPILQLAEIFDMYDKNISKETMNKALYATYERIHHEKYHPAENSMSKKMSELKKIIEDHFELKIRNKRKGKID